MNLSVIEKKRLRKKILIIDDCISSVQLISNILEYYDCDTSMAFDGEDSIPFLYNQKFDLVILDWKMPQLGGRDTLLAMDHLLSRNQFRRISKPIPYLIFTGTNEEDLDIPECDHFSYHGLLHKNWSLPSLLKTFNAVIRTL